MAEKKRILIIEDEHAIRELYAEVLRDAGFDVDEAMDGIDGLEHIMKKKYDLILIDIMLPKMDGLKVLKDIKQNERGGEAKVILLTNLARESIIKEGFALGAEGYLIKAEHNPGQLVEEMNKFLEST